MKRRMTMKRFFALSAFVLFLLMLPGTAVSDTLVLQDGTRISGVLVGRTSGTVTFKNSRGVVHRYKASQVQNVELTSAHQANYFSFQAEDGIRDLYVTGVQTCALPI